jgi:hypothetical protein
MEEVDFIVLHALARLFGVEVDAQTTAELTEDGFNRAKAAIADAIMGCGDAATTDSGFTDADADLVVSAGIFESAVDEANVWKEAYWATAMRLKEVAELLVDNHTALVDVAGVDPELIANLILLGVHRRGVGDVISARINPDLRERVLNFVNGDERMRRFFQEGPGNADA